MQNKIILCTFNFSELKVMVREKQLHPDLKILSKLVGFLSQRKMKIKIKYKFL